MFFKLIIILFLITTTYAKVFLDIPYSSHDLNKMDIYLPNKTNGKTPLIIHTHGGAWMFGDKKKTKKHGKFYSSNNVAFISLNYRLSPSVKHPTHIKDLAKAIATILKNLHKLNIDKNKVYLSGHSAGAHLSSLLATNQKYLKQQQIDVRDIKGVISVDTASYNLRVKNSTRFVKKAIRKSFGRNKHILNTASPLFNITANKTYPKFLVFASSLRDISIQEATKFVQKLKRHGVKTDFFTLAKTHKQMNEAMFQKDSLVSREILNFVKKP